MDHGQRFRGSFQNNQRPADPRGAIHNAHPAEFRAQPTCECGVNGQESDQPTTNYPSEYLSAWTRSGFGIHSSGASGSSHESHPVGGFIRRGYSLCPSCGIIGEGTRCQLETWAVHTNNHKRPTSVLADGLRRRNRRIQFLRLKMWRYIHLGMSFPGRGSLGPGNEHLFFTKNRDRFVVISNV